MNIDYTLIACALAASALLIYMRREVIALLILATLFIAALFCASLFVILVAVWIVWIGVTKGFQKK